VIDRDVLDEKITFFSDNSKSEEDQEGQSGIVICNTMEDVWEDELP
jgi:hypothetical protein